MEKVNWRIILLYLAMTPAAVLVIITFGYALNTIAEMGGG